MTDDHHLATRYRRDTNQLRDLTRVVLERDPPIQADTKQHYRDPVDSLALRGVPVANSGAGNHIAGSRPDTARID